MQLDHTRVTVRERGMLEICDLALHVCRDFSPKLLVMFVIGIVPLAVFNWFALQWLVDDLTGWGFARYAWLMILLVFIETPIATAAATLFLGDAMFLEPPTVRNVLKSLWSLSGKLFLTQGLLRGVIPAMGVALTLGPDRWLADVVLPMIAAYLVIMRAVRPFVNEIILLERNPLWSRDKRTITIARRSGKLHNPNAGELFGRYLGIICMSVLLSTIILFGVWFGVGTLFSDWTWGPVMLHVVFPASLWTVAAYMAVVRYLSYLDLRTRREGWALELLMRAEANRLQKQMGIH
mgnify:CR=1 FL=1